MGIVDDPDPERDGLCKAIFGLVDEQFRDTDKRMLIYSLICALAQAIADNIDVAGAAQPQQKAMLRHYQKVLQITVENALNSRPATTTTMQ
jgi:hypothetical protein